MREYQETQQAITGGTQKQGAFIIKNKSGEEIPAYSACKIDTMTIDATTGYRVFEVIKPDTDSEAHIVFSAGHRIPAAEADQLVLPKATLDYMQGGIPAKYTGAVVVGDTVGVSADTWTLTTGKTGFLVLGVDSTAGLLYVMPASGSGGGGGGAFDIVQVIEPPGTSGNAGTIGVKTISLTADPTLVPNFTQTGERRVVTYYVFE